MRAVARHAAVALAAGAALSGCGGASPSSAAAALVRMAGGQFVAGPMPEAQDGPEVHEVTSRNNTIHPGLQGKKLSGRVGPGARAVAVGFAADVGDVGYWITPAGIRDLLNPGDFSFEVSLTFAGNRDADPTGQGLTLGDHVLLFRAVDAVGRFGAPKPLTLHVVAAEPAGALVVSLAWDTEADLDLHVEQPDGAVIWARKINGWTPPSPGGPGPDPADIAAGGVLDFDSNSQCQIDGRRQENVAWSKTAPSGHYRVRVDAWSLCGETAARWTIKAATPDATLATASGQMGDTDTRFAHDAKSGLLVAEFDVP